METTAIECSGNLAFIRECSGSLFDSGGSISSEGDVIFYDWPTLFFMHTVCAARTLAADDRPCAFLDNLDVELT
jgi:hypothetical protein